MTTIERALAHPLIERLTHALQARPGTQLSLADPMRRAAVALILRVAPDDSIDLLMIKRAEHEQDPWSGHVALPGGRHEPGDRTLADTAIRETREETGVDLDRDGRIIGRLDELQPRTPTLPRLAIAPYVAVLARETPLVLSDEVAEAFWVPLTALQDPSASREIVLELTGGPRKVPSFQHAGYTIWGLTERILRQFLALIES